MIRDMFISKKIFPTWYTYPNRTEKAPPILTKQARMLVIFWKLGSGNTLKGTYSIGTMHLFLQKWPVKYNLLISLTTKPTSDCILNQWVMKNVYIYKHDCCQLQTLICSHHFTINAIKISCIQTAIYIYIYTICLQICSIWLTANPLTHIEITKVWWKAHQVCYLSRCEKTKPHGSHTMLHFWGKLPVTLVLTLQHNDIYYKYMCQSINNSKRDDEQMSSQGITCCSYKIAQWYPHK